MIADITGMTVLTRSDKRNDRVEISPEQLAAASAEAEVRFRSYCTSDLWTPTYYVFNYFLDILLFILLFFSSLF